MILLRILSNRNFIFLLAITLGLAFPQGAPWTEPLMLWALALAMMLATLNVPNDFFRSPRAIIKPSLIGILMTYAILSGVILLLSAVFIDYGPFRTGFVLIAAVPPAIAVIPFTGALNGNVPYSLAGTVAGYVAALLIMPVIFLLFLGTNFADPAKLMRIIAILIVLPMAVSRLLTAMGLHHRIMPVKGVLTDWSFFIVMYTIIGTNRDLIFEKPLMIVPPVMVAFAATFLMGFAIEKTGHWLKIDPADRISLKLLGTLKNLGIAGGLALSLFSKEAALPSAVYNIFMILYFVRLNFRNRLSARGPDRRPSQGVKSP